MNLTNTPERLDQLAASYALGTLRGRARRRFEAQARESATVRTAALLWQERLASMTELQAAQMPSPNVWKRIENLLATDVAEAQHGQAERARADRERSLQARLERMVGWWRGAAAAGALASLAAVLVGVKLDRDADRAGAQLADARVQTQQLTAQTQQLAAQAQQLTAQMAALPDIQYVAVLGDDQAAPSVLVTFDPKHRTMALRHVGNYHPPADKSLELWALPAGAAPKSMGVLGDQPVIRMPAVEGEVAGVPALAVTLEPKGGSQGRPAGPVLFKGALLRTTL